MKDFEELYEEIYENVPERFKEASKSNKHIEKRILIIALIIAFFILIIQQISPDIGKEQEIFFLIVSPIIMLSIIIMFILFMASIWMSKRKLESEDVLEYKKYVINKLIKNYSEKLEYYPEGEMSETIYQESGFDKEYKEYHSEDYIKGTIFEDCLFSMAEIDVRIGRTIVNKSNYITNKFHGLFVAVYLPKDISAEIEIYERNDFSSIVDKLSQDKYEIMRYEDFEQIYKVTTTNQIQATRLLTIEVTEKLEQFCHYRKIIPQIAIKNNVLYIRYKTGQIFDPNTLANGMDYYQLKRYYDILSFTIDFAEIFVKSMLEIGE